MDNFELNIEDPRWQDAGLEALAYRAVSRTLVHMALDPAICELGLLALDDARIAEFNGAFRDKAQATNVLSWPAEERGSDVEGGAPIPVAAGPDGLMTLGDIAIAYDTCAAQAVAAQKPLADHATHLIVHGVLHLLGYDHINDADAALMEGLEIEILGKMGLDDPYTEYSAV